MGFYCNGMKGICGCDILCADCTYFNNSGGEEKQTNADRIRAMSDEELAWAIDPAIVPPGMPKREWLKQPAEE